MTPRTALQAAQRNMPWFPGPVFSATGRINGVNVGSRHVSNKTAMGIIKQIGIEAGAFALGIEIAEAIQIWDQEKGKRRRRKGITASNLATTKRVINQVKKIHRELGLSRSTTRRKATCR